MKYPFGNLLIIAAVFNLSSCTLDDDVAEDADVTIAKKSAKSALNLPQSNVPLAGKWTISGLEIPECKLCVKYHLRLNEMMGHNLAIGDNFIFTQDSMFYEALSGQHFASLFQLKNNEVILGGHDWVYSIDVKKHTPDELILAVLQSYMQDVNGDEGVKYLNVKLAKAK